MSNPYNFTTQRPYGGKNVDRLLEACSENGWSDPGFATFYQAKKAGYNVIKGSTGTFIVTQPTKGTVKDPDTGEEKAKTFGGKGKAVFNLSQLEKSAKPSKGFAEAILETIS